MADVKVPALLHKMSKASQKAWYSKHGMRMPDDLEGKSAAAAKKVKAAPRKMIDIDPGSVRALNAARQQAYMAKGGRQPIGAAGSGGHSSMAGSNMSTAKGMIAGIKAGFNPKVSLDPYESERAKKVGPRSLKLNKESVDEAMNRVDLIKRAAVKNKMGAGAFLAKVNARAAQLSQQKKDDKITKSKANWGMSNEPVRFEEVQIDEVSKKEAESMLGGPVKEKPKMPPGKQPAGYRYVRNLARKAMNKGAVAAVHRSMEKTMKKEEVEQVVEQDDSMEKKEMAQTQLHFMAYAAKEILEFIDMGGEIEEWYQNKLSKVQSEVESLHSYIEGEKRRTGMVKEEEEQIDEKINLVKAKMGDVVKDFYKSKAPQFKGKSMAKRREMAVAAKLGAEREAGMREEVVTEAEGTVAVTPKEKALAAHHGDPKKITYGDVIKARLKSAAAKKMGK